MASHKDYNIIDLSYAETCTLYLYNPDKVMPAVINVAFTLDKLFDLKFVTLIISVEFPVLH